MSNTTGFNNTASGGLPNGTITVTPVNTITNSAGTVVGADIRITWLPPQGTASSSETTSVYTTRVILP